MSQQTHAKTCEHVVSKIAAQNATNTYTHVYKINVRGYSFLWVIIAMDNK